MDIRQRLTRVTGGRKKRWQIVKNTTSIRSVSEEGEEVLSQCNENDYRCLTVTHGKLIRALDRFMGKEECWRDAECIRMRTTKNQRDKCAELISGAKEDQDHIQFDPSDYRLVATFVKQTMHDVGAHRVREASKNRRDIMNGDGVEAELEICRALRQSRRVAQPATIQNDSEDGFITKVGDKLAAMTKAWEPVYNRLKNQPPDWDRFEMEYGQYLPDAGGIDECIPRANDLHTKARKCTEDSAAGSDGWAPKELRRLPLQAWEQRKHLLDLMIDTGIMPQAYYDVHSAAIPKKEKGVKPLDFRLLAIYSALYRVEFGAWFDVLFPRVAMQIHPDALGTAAGKDATDIAWEAQTDIESANANGSKIVIATYD